MKIKTPNNCFTLVEVLISLIVLSICISFMSRIIIKNGSNKTYNDIQKLENKFNQNQVLETDTLKLIRIN